MGIRRRDIVVDWISPRRRTMSGQRLGLHRLGTILHRLDQRKERVATEVMRRHDHVLNMNAVHTDEAVAEIIKRKAKLGAALRSFPLAQVRAESEIRLNLQNICASKAFNFATHQTARKINPVIDAEGGMTHPELGCVTRIKSRKQNFANVRATVVVRVL